MDTPQNFDSRKLEELYALTKQNNAMLHSMMRKARITWWLSLFYYLFIIASILGTYYYIQPFIQSAVSTFAAGTAPKGTSSFVIPPEVEKAIEQYLNLKK